MENLLIHLEAQRSILDGYCYGLNRSIKRLEDRIKKQELYAKQKVVRVEEKEIEMVNEIDQLIAKAEKLFQPECQKSLCSRSQNFESILSKKLSRNQSVEPSRNQSSIKLKTTLKKNHVTIAKPKVLNKANSSVPSATAKCVINSYGQKYIRHSNPLKAAKYKKEVDNSCQSLPQEHTKPKMEFLQDSTKDLSKTNESLEDNLFISDCNSEISLNKICNDEVISDKMFDDEFLSFYKKYLSLERYIEKLKCSQGLLCERKNAFDEFMSSLENSCTKESFFTCASQNVEYDLTFGQQVIDEINNAADENGSLDQVEIIRKLNNMIRMEQLVYKKNFINFTRKMGAKSLMSLKETDRQSSKIYKQLYYLLVDSYPTLIFSG
ncbi:uncharacterized protein LOC105844418 isoform X1 [Hydra vulgaris]|uniref:uncharacterized protein LOC105844418 isoform X1 n=1 Tax=Hydra vulgaris TaxID=6087 RepID=UPI001F5E5497|nr:uncharacterized protein LOC105844418 isoform X1 [Hydra vulgaris]